MGDGSPPRSFQRGLQRRDLSLVTLRVVSQVSLVSSLKRKGMERHGTGGGETEIKGQEMRLGRLLKRIWIVSCWGRNQ